MDIPPIHRAVQQAHAEAVAQLLLDDPATVDARDDLQWTPLHRVAAQGDATQTAHRAIGQLLLDAGADVNARDMAGQTPLHLIAMHGSWPPLLLRNSYYLGALTSPQRTEQVGRGIHTGSMGVKYGISFSLTRAVRSNLDW